jgi:UDP:flavonoid glycosyltransferase YjiC (YdhE family)
MRILYVPFHEGSISHQIPLLALNRLMRHCSVDYAFLLPKLFHEYFDRNQVSFLNLDYDGSVHREIEAYRKYRPDVVVDDWSLSTGFATSIAGIPRVTIQRISTFPGRSPRNSQHKHSIEIDFNRYPDVTALGLKQPRKLSDLFENASMKIIPGIRSVETLPDALKDDSSYVYCGPLLWDDHFVADAHGPESGAQPQGVSGFETLERFFDAHQDRKMVYFTFGNVAKAADAIRKCIHWLLEAEVAVITNIKVDPLSSKSAPHYLYAKFIPMHFVCSKVDLMIHPGSTGGYHYPILHNLPSITIGTNYYNYEDAAIRLHELGASVHLPAPEENDDFLSTFKTVFERYFGGSTTLIEDQKKALAALKSEVDKTAAEFNYEDVLLQAIQRGKGERSSSS